MNNLFIFGDSFSYPFRLNLEDTWMSLLSKKLNLELKLFSNPGASNLQIYFTIIDTINEIDKDDLVIISTSWCDRYYLPMFHHGVSQSEINLKKEHNIELDDLEKFYDEKYGDDISYRFYSEKFLNLFNLLDRLNINFYYWNVSNIKIKNEKNLIYPKYSEETSFFYEWFDRDKSMWLDSQDRHLGINGSSKLAEHFYKKINDGR